MTAPIPPVNAAIHASIPDAMDPRDGERRQGERRQKRTADTKALVAGPNDQGKAVSPAKPASVSPPPPAAFAAQILGQPGKKRGLRGGPEVLDTARSTYLSREYSGPNDRRPPTGQRKKTEI